MNCSMDHGRFFSDIFHDIDFPASGPMHFVDVVTHHPEGRPDALTARKFYSRLELSVRGSKTFSRCQSGRSKCPINVVGSGILLLDGFDNERTVCLKSIVVAVGVILKFAITPTPSPDFSSPFAFIDSCAVEFIVPDQLPFCWLIVGAVGGPTVAPNDSQHCRQKKSDYKNVKSSCDG